MNTRTVASFVEGQSKESSGDATVDVVNPSCGQRLFSLPAGTEEDANRAVASSRKAFGDGRWAGAAPSFRKRALYRFAELITAHAAALDELDAQEMGKPISTPFCNAAGAANLVRFYAEAVDKVIGDVYASDRYSFVAQRRVPRGVVAAIVPWNFPVFVAALKFAPALAAGNCVVLKPSELSSRSAIKLAQLAVEAGIPLGVLNVVVGLGETVGRALGLHMDVNMVTFTGSTAIGKKMLQYAGQSNMKLVMAECGGKSPQIVFDDVIDLNIASDRIAQKILVNQGQVCSAGTRLLVQKEIEGPLVEKITQRIQEIVMGDALDPKTTYGPIASNGQLAQIMQYVEGARGEGARLVAGGRRVLRETGGYFVEPTVFSNVQPQSRIAQDEIFGPVLSVISFKDEEDAIRIANSTMYGLAAYVWTTNIALGMRLANGILSSVFINAAPPTGEGAGHAFSSEPVGQSGVGVEGGLAGMESYMRRQLVWTSHS